MLSKYDLKFILLIYRYNIMWHRFFGGPQNVYLVSSITFLGGWSQFSLEVSDWKFKNLL